MFTILLPQLGCRLPANANEKLLNMPRKSIADGQSRQLALKGLPLKGLAPELPILKLIKK